MKTLAIIFTSIFVLSCNSTRNNNVDLELYFLQRLTSSTYLHPNPKLLWSFPANLDSINELISTTSSNYRSVHYLEKFEKCTMRSDSIFKILRALDTLEEHGKVRHVKLSPYLDSVNEQDSTFYRVVLSTPFDTSRFRLKIERLNKDIENLFVLDTSELTSPNKDNFPKLMLDKSNYYKLYLYEQKPNGNWEKVSTTLVLDQP